MIVFRDPAVEDVTLADRLRTLFSLSNAETTIAIDLARGLSRAHIAATRGVSANTLKTQTAALMGKMGCTRQAQVVATIAALPPITP